MKIFITLSRKSLAVILALIIIALILIGKFFSVGAVMFDGSTNAKRVEYINSLGYDVEESCISSKAVTIPESFGDVYKKYNALQEKAGFDLSLYKGKAVQIIAYSVKNEQLTVTLIIYKGRVIGGDVSSPRFDGEMKPLIENE